LNSDFSFKNFLDNFTRSRNFLIGIYYKKCFYFYHFNFIMTLKDKMLEDFAVFFDETWTINADIYMETVDFDSFGKLDSKAYRLMFESLVLEKGLNTSVTNYVILLSVLIKNKERIVNAVKTYESLSTNPDLNAAVAFINNSMDQYVNQTVNTASKRFPIVKLPESYASVSVAYATYFNKNLTAGWMLMQSYFGNMAMSDFLQDLNESAMRYLWTQSTTTTKNLGKARATNRKIGTFYEDIYWNTKRDGYLFYLMDGKKFMFKKTETEAGMESPVTIEDLVEYFLEVRKTEKFEKPENLNKKLTDFKFVHQDWKRFHPAFYKSLTDETNMIQRFEYDRITGYRMAYEDGMVGLLSDLLKNEVEYFFSGALTEIRVKAIPEEAVTT
jgi:hypothetical protein